ncbi:MAG: AAA family ATPase, partial [Deltaproteobacteria bacterium]
MGQSAAQLSRRLREELGKVIVGQAGVLDQLIAVLLAGGHVLLEGMPGIAKTLAVKTLAQLCRLEFQRIQCTPDLMPGDILGVNIYNTATGTFSFRRGPVFTDLLLVD